MNPGFLRDTEALDTASASVPEIGITGGNPMPEHGVPRALGVRVAHRYLRYYSYGFPVPAALIAAALLENEVEPPPNVATARVSALVYDSVGQLV